MTYASQAASALPNYHTQPHAHVKALMHKYRKFKTSTVLIIDLTKQTMHRYEKGKLVKTYKISSSKFGIGNQAGSNKTPLGVHFIKQRFGDHAPLGTIFKARRNTGKIATLITDKSDAKADYVTSRVMWLKGLEPGKNKGPGIDSYRRFIYIHGTAEEGKIGEPASHGCIRMYNKDVIEMYRHAPIGTLVNIIR